MFYFGCMMAPRMIVLFLVCVSSSVSSSDESSKIHEKSQVVGIDTVNTIKIDKDTIINRNLRLETKGNKKRSQKEFDRDPDWSYQSFPKQVAQHAEDFKRNMSECLKEVQAKDNRQIKRLSPKTESPIHGECLIACVLKRNGVIMNGKVHKDNLIALVSKFYAKEDKLMKTLEKGVDYCINKSIKNKDECTVASQLNECTNNILSINKHKVTLNV